MQAEHALNPFPTICATVSVPRFFIEVLGAQPRSARPGVWETTCPWCEQNDCRIRMTDDRFACSCGERCDGTVMEAAACHMAADTPGEAAVWLADRFEIEEALASPILRSWRASLGTPRPEHYGPPAYQRIGYGKYRAAGPLDLLDWLPLTPATAERLHTALSGPADDPSNDPRS